jgi:hypothetical protein
LLFSSTVGFPSMEQLTFPFFAIAGKPGSINEVE